MKCLEGYSVEQIKNMSYEELKVLGQRAAEEEHEGKIRSTLVNIIETMDANKAVIDEG